MHDSPAGWVCGVVALVDGPALSRHDYSEHILSCLENYIDKNTNSYKSYIE